MQTPPLIVKPKKNKTGLIILIITSVLIILCVVLVLISTSWAKTPEGIAALTQGAINKTSTFISIAIEPTTTPKPANYKPTKTTIPTKTPIPTKTLQPTITPTATKELSGLTFEEIKAFKENATDIQWDEYKKQINGKRVNWTGTIYNVDKQGNGYFIFICMDSYCNSVSFNLSNKDIALGLNKTQTVTFEGYINTTLMDFLALNFSVSLDNVKITN